MEQLSIQIEASLKRTYPIIGKRGVENIKKENIILSVFIINPNLPTIPQTKNLATWWGLML
jgi:hypothetical protein